MVWIKMLLSPISIFFQSRSIFSLVTTVKANNTLFKNQAFTFYKFTHLQHGTFYYIFHHYIEIKHEEIKILMCHRFMDGETRN